MAPPPAVAPLPPAVAAERFVEACDRMAQTLRKAAFRVLHDVHDAEDTVQDAYLAAWKSLPTLREPQALEGWMLRIARNRAVSRARFRRRQGSPEARAHDDALDGAGDLPRVVHRRGSVELRPDHLAAFRDALREMPPPVFEALDLRYVRGLTLREIADRQGTSVGGVKTRLYRGRDRLRRAVGP